MKKQTVVRTCPKEYGYSYDPTAYEHLWKKLDEGWIVVMCNHIDDELEYILEREETNEQHTEV